MRANYPKPIALKMIKGYRSRKPSFMQHHFGQDITTKDTYSIHGPGSSGIDVLLNMLFARTSFPERPFNEPMETSYGRSEDDATTCLSHRVLSIWIPASSN